MIQAGYDGEGKVIITILSMADGKPVQTTASLEPKTAVQVAEGIMKAADEATAWRETNERNRADAN